jgi:2-oxoglutarate dehydrogenase E1 component
LVIFAPKSLLRFPRAASRPNDFAHGRFHAVFEDERAAAEPARVRRVVLCSGKLYYDLLAECEKRGSDFEEKVALVRVEQLYPWPDREISQVVRAFPEAECVTWAQEEPANMGAWTFVRERLQDLLRPAQKLAYAGRRASASPAVGSMGVHKQEQAAILAAAFAGLD